MNRQTSSQEVTGTSVPVTIIIQNYLFLNDNKLRQGFVIHMMIINKSRINKKNGIEVNKQNWKYVLDLLKWHLKMLRDYLFNCMIAWPQPWYNPNHSQKYEANFLLFTI